MRYDIDLPTTFKTVAFTNACAKAMREIDCPFCDFQPPRKANDEDEDRYTRLLMHIIVEHLRSGNLKAGIKCWCGHALSNGPEGNEALVHNLKRHLMLQCDPKTGDPVNLINHFIGGAIANL